MNNDQKDERLWRIAKKRVAFKHSFLAYFIVDAFLVAVWYFSSGWGSYFWPKWPMIGWGLGLVFQYFEAYHEGIIFSADDEYEKMKRNQMQ